MRTLLLAAMIAWHAIGSAAAAEDAAGDDPFAAAGAAFTEGNYALALSRFTEALDRGVDGPAIHYNIGVCHYRLGDYRSAEAEFALIAETYPDMRGLAQYNLGLVAQKRGDEAEAQGWFRQALANSEDEKIRYLAGRQLDAAPPPASDRWLTLIDARFGHDDNVLLLAEEIPLPDGESAESTFTEFWALVTGPLSEEQGLRFDGSVYGVRYPDASVFDQTALRLGTVYQWRWGAWDTEAGPYFSHTTLDGDPFEQRLGVGARLRRDLTAETSLGIRFIHDEVTEGEERFAAFDGSREWLEVRVDRDVTQGRLSVAYALESNDRAAATVSPTRNKLSLRYRHFFGQDWLADMQVSWRDSRYDDLPDPREEDLSELSFALTRTLPRGWQVGGEVSLADNDSNLPTVAYDRTRAAVGLAKQF